MHSATKVSEGSHADTASMLSRSTSMLVNAPGPHPTSNADIPGVIPAAAAKATARGCEYRPMNAS